MMSDTSPNWNHVLEKYSDWLAQQPLSGSTKRVYLSTVRQFIQYAQGSHQAVQWQNSEELPKIVHRYLKELSTANSSSVTWTFSALSSLTRCMGTSAIQVVRSSSSTVGRVAHLSDEQLCLYEDQVTQLRSQRDRVLVLLILRSGLRVTELIALKRCDVADSGDKLSLNISGRNSRKMELQADLAAEVRALLAAPSAFAQLTAPVFATKSGRSLDVQGIDSLVRSTGNRAGLAVSATILRSTFLLTLMRDGADLRTVAQICGQTRIDALRRLRDFATVLPPIAVPRGAKESRYSLPDATVAPSSARLPQPHKTETKDDETRIIVNQSTTLQWREQSDIPAEKSNSCEQLRQA